MKGNESEKRNGNREDTTIHTLHPRRLVRSSGKPITMTTTTTTMHKTTSILQAKIKKQSMLPGTFRFPFGPERGRWEEEKKRRIGASYRELQTV